MKLDEGLLKFKEYFNSQGLFYALIRGVKYLIFLVRDNRNKKKQARHKKQKERENQAIQKNQKEQENQAIQKNRKEQENQARREKQKERANQAKREKIIAQISQARQESPKISKGKLVLVFSGSGINIFYERRAITSLAGLNVGIYSLGLWTDSTKAEWCLLEKAEDLFRFRVRFKELCVHQIWTVRVKNENEIEWEVVSGFDEQIYINEIRYLALIRPRYKSWFWDYHSYDFSRPDDQWHSLCLEEKNAAMVGARFSVQDENLPSFSIECGKRELLPIVQSLPAKSNAHIIGFRAKNEQFYSEKTPHDFLATIRFYNADTAIDEKMEFLRQRDMKHSPALPEKSVKTKEEDGPRALLLNLPWSQGEKWGVRAGSRWPHIKDVSEGNYLPFPFFLATAASLLKKNNIRASLIDAIAEKIPEDLFIEKVFNADEEYWVIETSVPSFYNDLRMIKRLSKAGRSIILCGPNAEIYKPEFLEKNKDVDFVLCGEYEWTLLELIQALQSGSDLSGVQGLIYRDRGEVIKNPLRVPCDIDRLPWPDRTMPSVEKYWDLPGDIPHPSVQMLASRGCSFGCHFCLWPQVMYRGNHYRTRDLKDVIDEMEYLVRQRKFKSVYFDDDTFNIGKERMLDFCRLLKKRGLQDVPWAIMARADLMDEEILLEMKSAGLWAVKYGVESQEKRFLKDSRKELDLDKTTKIIKKTKALGIKVHLTFCFGFTGETKETIQKTLEYAIDADPDSVQFSILTPFPGTILFNELDKEGRILTREWDRYDGHQSCIFRPDLLTPEDLVRAKNRAYALWGEHKRKKRGFGGDMKRFSAHWQAKGPSYSLQRAYGYLRSRWNNKKLNDEKS